MAQKRLKAKEFKAAETQFEACLADVEVIESLPQHEVVDLKLDLAIACRGAGNSTRQQSILNNLLKLDLPKVQELHLKHTLAVAYLDDFQLDLARDYADDARKGRKKLLGRRHELYFESLSLLATICEAQNDNDTAEAYQGLLPPDYHKHEVQVRIFSLQTSKPNYFMGIPCLNFLRHCGTNSILLHSCQPDLLS